MSPLCPLRKGLGTGEVDGVTVNKWLGHWTGYFEGVWNFIGKSSDLALKDYFGYELGLGCQITDRYCP